MKNMRIIHLAKLKMSKSDLAKIDKRELAFLSTIAFAIDEISVIQKLYAQSISLQPRNEELLLMSAIQQNTIARVLSSKLYEAIGLFDKYQVTLKRKGDQEAVEALASHQAALVGIKKLPGYPMAKFIRDHVTNHYLHQETEKNIEYVSEKAQYVAFLHEMQGNSYYPFGEEVVFLGRVGRYFYEEYERTFNASDINHWYDWIKEASKWFTKMFYSYVIWLYRTRFPDWMLVPTKPYLDYELFGELGHSPLPIFFAADRWLAEKHDRERES